MRNKNLFELKGFMIIQKQIHKLVLFKSNTKVQGKDLMNNEGLILSFKTSTFQEFVDKQELQNQQLS